MLQCFRRFKMAKNAQFRQNSMDGRQNGRDGLYMICESALLPADADHALDHHHALGPQQQQLVLRGGLKFDQFSICPLCYQIALCFDWRGLINPRSGFCQRGFINLISHELLI